MSSQVTSIPNHVIIRTSVKSNNVRFLKFPMVVAFSRSAWAKRADEIRQERKKQGLSKDSLISAGTVEPPVGLIGQKRNAGTFSAFPPSGAPLSQDYLEDPVGPYEGMFFSDAKPSNIEYITRSPLRPFLPSYIRHIPTDMKNQNMSRVTLLRAEVGVPETHAQHMWHKTFVIFGLFTREDEEKRETSTLSSYSVFCLYS